MRIDPATVAAHRFQTVRRRGYDPDEVDAVMARLAETVREYETALADLQTRLDAANESAEAVQRTYLAAVRTRDEMTTEARTEADEIRRAAREEADQIKADVLAEMSQATEAIAAARAQAEGIIATAEEEARTITGRTEELLAEATTTAEERLAEARRVAGEAEEEAQRAAGRTALQAAGDASAIRSEAERHAMERYEEAAREAANLVTAARQEADAERDKALAEHRDVATRLSTLRAALATIEADLQAAASLTLDRFTAVSAALDGVAPRPSTNGDAPPVTVVDLTDAALARENGDLKNGDGSAEIEGMSDFPWDESAVLQMFASRPAGKVARPDGSGMLPAAREVLNLASARSGDGHEDAGSHDTIYQRRSGGLKRRLGAETVPFDSEDTASAP